MTNTSDSDPNFPIPSVPSNVILPSYNSQNPSKKRTRNETDASSSSRTKPAKKPNLDGPKNTRPCTECGKQFWSLKALFGHMRCHPERQWRGINPPPNYQRGTTATSSGWISVTSEEDHDIAASLLMLANGSSTDPSGMDQGVHKDIKGCFITQDSRKRKSKSSGNIHQCNICFRVFPSGQALGGHMRCHWERDQKENQDLTVIDLNVPSTQNLPSSASSTGCSLDLRLGL